MKLNIGYLRLNHREGKEVNDFEVLENISKFLKDSVANKVELKT